MYLSSIAGEQEYAPTPQAQAWTLAYGVVPVTEQDRVVDALLTLLSPDPAQPNVEIYGMFWVLEALGRTGRIADGLDIIARYYGRLLDLGATTWWEHFVANESYTAALSHGWGGSPTWFLTTYALGVQRTGPQSWQITPGMQEPGLLAGAIPLQDGILSLRWNYPDSGKSTATITDTAAITNSNRYDTQLTTRLHIDAPATSTGEVILPGDSYDANTITIIVNGIPLWEHGTAFSSQVVVVQRNGDLVIPLPGGSYAVEIVRSNT
jgi:hypothetical protein